MLSVTLRQTHPVPLDVQLECRPGQVLALVGPSGSGKSTTLRCIAGLHRPRWGQVRVGHRTWLDTDRGIDLSPQQRRVGMVFQSYALFPHLTALDNVALALGHLPRARRPDHARALLARVRLEGLEQRRPGALSGGQQQRVALARALAREPLALLLDEPFSAVDQVTRRKLRMELAVLTRSLDIPILLVTHDLDEAVMLADCLCVIHAGHSLQSGTPDRVLSHPEDATVARLLDLRNLFTGRVRDTIAGGDRMRLEWAAGVLEVRRDPRFAPGERVHWVIPGQGVLLHQRRRPSRGERENPVHGRIVELLKGRSMTTVVVAVDDQAGLRLTLELPLHVAQRNHLALGEPVGLSLLGERIHLMPFTRRHGPEA